MKNFLVTNLLLFWKYLITDKNVWTFDFYKFNLNKQNNPKLNRCESRGAGGGSDGGWSLNTRGQHIHREAEKVQEMSVRYDLWQKEKC